MRNQKVAGHLFAGAALLALAGCSSLPDTHFEKHAFPQDAYVGDVKDRPYDVLGLVKTRVDFQTLDANHDEGDLCRNYFNKGARDLLKLAKEKGATAVIDVKSVVFFEDGKSTTYQTPECSDDGQDGQILLQGIAVKWKAEVPESAEASAVSPTAVPIATRPKHSTREMLGKDWPYVAPSAQRYKSIALEKTRDGLDGGIRVMADPNRIVLFTTDRKILDVQPYAAKKLWFTAEYLRSSAERSILVSQEVAQAATNAPEITTKLFDLHAGKLELESWIDSASGNADHLTLTRSAHSAWKLTDTVPHDIVQVTSQPEIGELTYIRYHFAGKEKGWVKSMRAEAGTWTASQPFPPEDRFPALGAPSATAPAAVTN